MTEDSFIEVLEHEIARLCNTCLKSDIEKRLLDALAELLLVYKQKNSTSVSTEPLVTYNN